MSQATITATKLVAMADVTIENNALWVRFVETMYAYVWMIPLGRLSETTSAAREKVSSCSAANSWFLCFSSPVAQRNA